MLTMKTTLVDKLIYACETLDPRKETKELILDNDLERNEESPSCLKMYLLIIKLLKLILTLQVTLTLEERLSVY